MEAKQFSESTLAANVLYKYADGKTILSLQPEEYKWYVNFVVTHFNGDFGLWILAVKTKEEGNLKW